MTSTPTERHLEEAMSWLLRLDEAQSDATVRDEHRSWLARDPLNSLAWQQARKGWTLIDRLEPVTRPEWPQNLPSTDASGKVVKFAGRRPLPALWLGAAVAACLLVAAMPAILPRAGTEYATSTAEIRAISLTDGSKVQLAPESAFSVSLTAQSRTVRMSNGRAFFEVTKDAARPFIVQAGDISVTVLGTAFDLRVSDDTIAVAVQHGRVGVRPSQKQVEEYLAPGDQITIRRSTGSIEAETVPETAVGSWKEGQLSVFNTSVAEVVSEIRRYHRGWVIIADDSLAAERVTGLYNLQKPDMALAAMVQPVGGSVRQFSPFLMILSKSAK